MAPDKPVASAGGVEEADLAKVFPTKGGHRQQLTPAATGVSRASERRENSYSVGEPAERNGGQDRGIAGTSGERL